MKSAVPAAIPAEMRFKVIIEDTYSDSWNRLDDSEIIALLRLHMFEIQKSI